VRFVDFLKATVLLSAGSATLLATLTVIGLSREFDATLAYVSAAWWAMAVLTGIWLGRRAETTPPIARLLAGARSVTMLPEIRPGLILINRLWPLLLSTLAAGILAFFVPQVAAIAAGFGLIWALAWRRQESAVSAIEERDAVRFYVDRTSPLKPMALIRTPGFGGNFLQYNGRSS
jgi:hypothetical protein